ncbi:MAG: diaminopimelate decarboxylase [Gemmatimonadaceae bacterium]
MGEGLLTVSGYTRRDGALACEDVPLAQIAERVGTPCYVYSAGLIRQRYHELSSALSQLPVHIHYSVKANSSLSILALLRRLGAGVDIVSGGELHRALQAGFKGSDIVFSGVGKTPAELELALLADVSSVNVESEGELFLLQEVAARLGRTARISLRVNPDVAVQTPHPYTRTGEHGMKFGIPHDRIMHVARVAQSMPNVLLAGLAAHVGSQISTSEPYAMAATVLITLKREIEAEIGAAITTLDVGGGLAVTYDTEERPDLDAYADALAVIGEEPGTSIIIEPGRFLVAESGTLLTRVLYRKQSGGKEIVITDAAMNDLIRPSLYESHHGIDVVGSDAPATMQANIVGPVCESGDFFARDRSIADVQPGELLAVRTVGAYGFSMASNYNSRRRPAEVLVDGSSFAVITERETYADLTTRESLTPNWTRI